MGQLLLGDEGPLRTGSDVNASIVALPGDRAVSLEVNVLNSRGGIGHLVDGFGRGKPFCDAANSPCMSG